MPSYLNLSADEKECQVGGTDRGEVQTSVYSLSIVSPPTSVGESRQPTSPTSDFSLRMGTAGIYIQKYSFSGGSLKNEFLSPLSWSSDRT